MYALGIFLRSKKSKCVAFCANRKPAVLAAASPRKQNLPGISFSPLSQIKYRGVALETLRVSQKNALPR